MKSEIWEDRLYTVWTSFTPFKAKVIFSQAASMSFKLLFSKSPVMFCCHTDQCKTYKKTMPSTFPFGWKWAALFMYIIENPIGW